MDPNILLYPTTADHNRKLFRDYDITDEGKVTMAGRLAIDFAFDPPHTIVYHDRADPLGGDMDTRPGGSEELLMNDAWAVSAIKRALFGEGPAEGIS